MNMSRLISLEQEEGAIVIDERAAFLTAAEIQQQQGSDNSDTESDYFRLFNSRNAKLFALALVALLMLYHSILHLQRIREDSCIGLLKGGRYQGDHIWQPYGCMLHMYSRADSRVCMKNKHQTHARNNWIVFVGDARMRQIYAQFVDQFSTEPFKIDHNLPLEDSHFRDKDVFLDMDFASHLYVDTWLKNKLAAYMNDTPKRLPSLLVIGVALASINETGGFGPAMKDYAANVSLLLPYIQQMRLNTTVLWLLQGPVDQHKLREANNGSDTNVTNHLISTFNHEAESILFYSPVKLWKSAAMLSAGYNRDSPDGVLFGPVALQYDTQVLVNMYCNEIMNFRDGTCCGKSEALTRAQLLSFVVYFVCIAIAGVSGIVRCDIPALSSVSFLNNENKRAALSRAQSMTFPVLVSLAKLCLLMLFCYICDRGDFFMKENKWFTYFNLFLPTAYLTVLGLFFTESTSNTEFLHLEQTNEWKGWMQLVILCYNLTGASQLWTYMAFRCLFSAYLFLYGYGHFMYFWTTADFSLRRVVQVLFRYNLLVVLLCLTMNRYYQFYDFVPLVSYWFIITYITMALPPRVTAASAQNNPMQYCFVVLKFVVLFSLISVLYMSEIFFEKVHVFGPWRWLFVNADDSIIDWWAKWSQDRYTAGCGMALGFVVVVMRRYYFLNDAQPHSLFSKRITALCSICSISGFLLYGAMAVHCRTKADCIEVHAYVVVAPIICYLLVRNLFGFFRTRVSTFFSWFGRITLEVFTAQAHIWLAADGNGVLVVLPRWPVLNVLVSWFLFVCVAHELRAITRHLSDVFAPENELKTLLRNVLLLLCCVPLGLLMLDYF